MQKICPIKILNKQDQSILEEFTMSDMEKAYAQMKYYEELGLDVSLEIPGATHTLALSLKVPPSQFNNLSEDLNQEIADHED